MEKRIPHSILAFGSGTAESGIVMLTDDERELIVKTLDNSNWLAHSGDDVLDIEISPIRNLKQFDLFMDVCVFDGLDKEECDEIITQFESNPDFVSWFGSQRRI